MGLKVWLPLNGTLENRGISQVTINNTGSVLADGKTGSCYSYSTTTYTHINGNTIAGLNKFTVCCWVYLTNASTYTVFTSEDNGGYWQFVLSSNYLRVRDTVSGVTGSRMDKAITAMPVSTWTHVAMVYDNGVVSHYRNGELIETLTFHQGASMNAHNRLYIGSDALNSSYQGNCRVNDFRIYDYCLSAKEVRDISRGLVLHYKLDMESVNILPFSLDSNNYVQSNYSGRTSSNITNGIYHVDGLQSETAADTSFTARSTSFITLSPDTDYYLSFNCKSKSSNTLYFNSNVQAYTGLFDSSNTYYKPATEFTLGTSYDGWVSLKIHTGSDTQYKISLGFDTPNIYGVGSYIEFSNVMLSLEKPDGYRFHTDGYSVYDSSGYHNDGMVAGTLCTEDDTPRYPRCIRNIDNYVLNTEMYFPESEGLSICCWINLTEWGYQTSGIWATSNISTPSDYLQTTCNHRDFGFDIRGTNGTSYRLTCDSTDIPTGSWKYVVFTHDGNYAKLYINGTLKRQVAVPTPLVSFNYLYLGWSDAGGASRKCKGKWSDFRVYATALSAEDIMDLYNAPEYIDNCGTMGAFEFVENSTDGQEIGKNGVVGVKNFIEYSDNLKLMPDGSVFLKLLRHNNPASKLFTENNNWLNTSDPDLYSSLIQLKNVDWMKNLSEYEFLACEKLTSSASESQVRFKQTSNPATSSTATGYQLISGNPPRDCGLMNKNTYGAFHNGNSWWCCCGCYTAYQGGIPGFTGIVTTGYTELYIRIPDGMIKGYVDGDAKFFKQSINARQFKEI